MFTKKDYNEYANAQSQEDREAMYKYENTFDMLIKQMAEYIIAIQNYKLNPINPKQKSEMLRAHNLTTPLMYSAGICLSKLCHRDI